MIQILGLRDILHKNRTKKVEKFFEKGWRLESLKSLFDGSLETLLTQIPKEEQFNLYYTVADCKEELSPGEKGRRLVAQWAIPFDVDGIDVSKAEAVARIGIQALGLSYEHCPVVFSGNGVQWLVPLLKPITSDEHFDAVRMHYRALVALIDMELARSGLAGKCDPSVWSPARLMRLPQTLNRKPGKEERLSQILQGGFFPVDFDLAKRSGLPLIDKTQQISETVLKRFIPDSEGVLRECEFLKWCRDQPGEVKENQWYAMLSITGRLKDGVRISHEYSQGHPGYSQLETDLKIQQALASSGPRRCENIESLWPGCVQCKHYKTSLVSPFTIKTDSYIETQGTGFHKTSLDKNGQPTTGKPCYEDLRRYYESLHPYITDLRTKMVHTYNGQFWEPKDSVMIEGFAQVHFKPAANNNMCREFSGLMRRTNHRHEDWLDGSVAGLINLQNGVLNIQTGEFTEHSQDYGFRSVLPYDYDSKAQCPRFQQFMDEITKDDQDLQNVLLEFAGYAVSNGECKHEKALILSGGGSNGKSTFIRVLKSLVGAGSYSTLNLKDLFDPQKLAKVDGKLFNISEETPRDALRDSSVFKEFVSGGEVMVKQVYANPYQIKVRAKAILSINDNLFTMDKTHAMARRLLIVPFLRQFSSTEADKLLHTKLQKELPGILNLVLEGYQRLERQGLFTSNRMIEGKTLEFMDDSDSVAEWFNEYCKLVEDPNVFAPIGKIFDQYRAYAERGCHRPDTIALFSRKVKSRLPYERRSGERRYVNGKQERGYVGLEVRDDSEF